MVSEQGGDKDREGDVGEQEDNESGKEVNFYFSGLTPFLFSPTGYSVILNI